MVSRNLLKTLTLIVTLTLGPTLTAQGSLSDQLNTVFNDVIDIKLGGVGNHGNHFKSDAVDRNRTIIDVIENYLAVNTAAYPLTSSAASITYDFSSGAPVARLSDVGPVYSQRAETLGKKRLSIGLNWTTQHLQRIRGVNTEDLEVDFFHQNLNDPTVLGDDVMEQDYISMHMDMDISARILALFATYGLSDRLDIGIAIPIVSINLKVNSTAFMNSMSTVVQGSPLHYWTTSGGTPTLTYRGQPLDESSSGLGDIALRLKYNLLNTPKYGLAAYAEYRMATGNEEDFLGTGHTSFRPMLIGSSKIGAFTPHGNIALDFRGGELERDQFELTLGYDFQASNKLTLITDWIGEFELGESVDQLQFPEATIIKPTFDNSVPFTRSIPSSNVPNSKNDHITNLSVGAKLALSDKLIAMGNLLIPTGTNGLRANYVPTIGLELAL